MLIPSTSSSKPVIILWLWIDPPPAPWGIHWFPLFFPIHLHWFTSLATQKMAMSIYICVLLSVHETMVSLQSCSSWAGWADTVPLYSSPYGCGLSPCLHLIVIFFLTHATGFERLVHEPLNLWKLPGRVTLSLRRLIVFNWCSFWHFRQISSSCTPLNNTLTVLRFVFFTCQMKESRRQKSRGITAVWLPLIVLHLQWKGHSSSIFLAKEMFQPYSVIWNKRTCNCESQQCTLKHFSPGNVPRRWMTVSTYMSWWELRGWRPKWTHFQKAFFSKTKWLHMLSTSLAIIVMLGTSSGGFRILEGRRQRSGKVSFFTWQSAHIWPIKEIYVTCNIICVTCHKLLWRAHITVVSTYKKNRMIIWRCSI